MLAQHRQTAPVIVLVPPSEGKAPGGRGAWEPSTGAFGQALGGQRVAIARTLFGDGLPPALPAWRRYTGVVWKHLDPATLTAGQRRRLVVPSGLMGLARGDDPVPDHRLKMQASTWRDAITEALIAHGRGPIVDLLPNEHAKAIDWDRLTHDRRTVRVAFSYADSGTAAGLDAKAVKCIVARALVQHGIAALTDFEGQGWTAAKTKSGFVVTRPNRARL